MRKTAIMKDDLFMEHDPGRDHVESPNRLRVIYEQLDKPEIAANFLFPAFEPVGRDIIALNHDDAHFKRVAASSGKPFDMLDPDTTTSPKSFDAACLAVGALVEGARLLAEGEIDNCFALVRPPGHHAESDRSMGFCLFNNVAIAAQYALQKLNMKRVLIIDWDLHHGNGTQHSFYDSNKVLYFSSHQYPYYPGSGAATEFGNKNGEGYTLNVPLSGGQGDGEFARIFNELVVPVTRQFKPDMIMVSAGFDIYKGDPLGAMDVTTEGFAYMTRVLLELANELCQGRLLVTLEGGYHIGGQRDGVLAVLAEMVGKSMLKPEVVEHFKNAKGSLPTLDNAKQIAKNFWSL
jgi:acetoin utilization deacetylase AcuC-like enzyme